MALRNKRTRIYLLVSIIKKEVVKERKYGCVRVYRKCCSSCSACSDRKNMREKTIEHKLTIAAKNMGGIALKFVSPGFDGMPDRIVLLPDGHIGFVEVKSIRYHP